MSALGLFSPLSSGCSLTSQRHGATQSAVWLASREDVPVTNGADWPDRCARRHPSVVAYDIGHHVHAPDVAPMAHDRGVRMHARAGRHLQGQSS